MNPGGVMNRLKLIVLFIFIIPMYAKAYHHLSPYSYCAGNPVNNVDSSGCVIEGVTKKDAALVVEDFRAMFHGDEFANFRNRIVQSGKKQNGHGRSLLIGRGDANQHVEAIQTENLILRVMGIPYINTGADHAPNGAFPGCILLPSFR